MSAYIKKYGLIFLILILIIFLIFLFSLDKNLDNNKLTFAILDIGQGDSIFIKSTNGTKVLIDGGKDKTIIKELNNLLPFYDRDIDIIIMTNPDLDHIGGFIHVLEKYKVKNVFEPGSYNDSYTYKALQKKIKESNINHYFAKEGMRIDIGGGAYIDFLFPNQDVSTWDNNDASVVALLYYGNNKILLMGDSTIKTENIIMENFTDDFLKSSIIKIGHHGSKTSSSLEFLEKVNPKYALISVGKNNKYGHPHKEVIDNLNTLNIEILRTDERGTIVFICDKMDCNLINN